MSYEFDRRRIEQVIILSGLALFLVLSRRYTRLSSVTDARTLSAVIPIADNGGGGRIVRECPEALQLYGRQDDAPPLVTYLQRRKSALPWREAAPRSV